MTEKMELQKIEKKAQEKIIYPLSIMKLLKL